jgi:hypothetical protein
MMADLPQSVRWSVRIYEKILLAYPAEFREKFASEMILLFHELATEAIRRRGRFGLFLFWCRVLGDLLRTAPQELGSALWGRFIMKTAIRTVLWGVLATLIEMVVFGFFWIIFGTYVFLVPGVNWHAVERYIYFAAIVGYILPPFVAGVILARTKPFFRPYVTAPLGMMLWGGLILCLSGGPSRSPCESVVLGYIVFYCVGALGVAFLGSVTLLGCITATKLSRRLSRTPTPPQIATPLL